MVSNSQKPGGGVFDFIKKSDLLSIKYFLSDHFNIDHHRHIHCIAASAPLALPQRERVLLPAGFCSFRHSKRV